MSDMDTPAQDEPEMERSRGSSRITLMVIALVVVLGAGGWWAWSQYQAHDAAERAQLEARSAAKRKADQEAKRASEDAKLAADLQAQKLAADEALRRAQEDRDRVARELEQYQSTHAGAKKRAK